MRNKVLWLTCFVAWSHCQQIFANPADLVTDTASAVSAVPAATEAVQAADVSAVPEAASLAAIIEQATLVNKTGASAAPIETKVPPEQSAAPVKTPSKMQAVVSESYFMKLAQKRGCFECHELDKKTVGPSWKDVAAKYRGDAGAPARLVTKIFEGGGGVWGKKSMTAQTHTSKAERTLLVKFILNLK